MGTTAGALTSSSNSTATFNGTSQYAADLQQAITHAVAVASIPLTELQDNVSTLQSQASEITTLQNDFGSLQTAIQQLSSSTGNGSLAATLTDNSVATVTVDPTSDATPGTYDLNVTSAGLPTTTLSNSTLPTVSDPSQSSISSASSFTLTVGSSTYTVSPTANTLDSLAQAINGGNYGVSATIVNIGPPTAPDYRLSLQSSTLGNETIQLNDGSDLLTVLTPGAPAQYQVDGQPSTPISSNSSTVTIAPGVTADLLQAGDTTVTVAPSSTAAANALSAFATAYNSAITELNNNHGTVGGALTGQSIILQLEQSLGSLLNYTGGSGSVQNLTDLGLSFNSSGQLSFDQATFEGAESSDPSGVASFLGSATTSGFLQSATNVFTALEDPNTGVFAAQQLSTQQQISSDNQEITQTQARITTMQNTLTAQMTQADTMIASLESQVSYFTTLFTDQQQDDTQTNG
jgi:flagellar hook-associated protein 2